LIKSISRTDTLGVGLPLPPFFSPRSLDRNQFAQLLASVGWRQIEQRHYPPYFKPQRCYLR
jgi:hypothetical protein